MDPDYEIFDLLVERHASGYRARVLNSPAGNETAELQQPISDEQFQSFLFTVGRPRRLTRRVGPSVSDETKKFGTDLLNFLFPERIRACFERSRFAAASRHRGLRVQIRLTDVPELCDLPWEFLYHDEAGFVALSTQTPVVRFLEIRQPTLPLSLQHPLRILVLISGPRDLPRLDVDREWSKLRDAVADIEAKGLVQIEKLETPRLSRLNRRLRMEQFHILHFIGHGDFDDTRGFGVLYFEDDQGRSAPVSAEQLSTALRDHPSVRLVILNSCEGARSSRTDPFTGTAQTLIRTGVPAVIAMQFEVTDDAAIAFSSELYTSLALGDSVDRSLSEARKAIYLDGNELEWATPVLYLRSPDSRIFTLPSSAKIEEERAEHEAARSAAGEAGDSHADAAGQAEIAPRASEEQRKTDETARHEEERRKSEAASRLAEQQRKASDSARRAEELRRTEDATRPAEEEQSLKEEAPQTTAKPGDLATAQDVRPMTSRFPPWQSWALRQLDQGSTGRAIAVTLLASAGIVIATTIVVPGFGFYYSRRHSGSPFVLTGSLLSAIFAFINIMLIRLRGRNEHLWILAIAAQLPLFAAIPFLFLLNQYDQLFWELAHGLLVGRNLAAGEVNVLILGVLTLRRQNQAASLDGPETHLHSQPLALPQASVRSVQWAVAAASMVSLSVWLLANFVIPQPSYESYESYADRDWQVGTVPLTATLFVALILVFLIRCVGRRWEIPLMSSYGMFLLGSSGIVILASQFQVHGRELRGLIGGAFFSCCLAEIVMYAILLLGLMGRLPGRESRR